MRRSLLVTCLAGFVAIGPAALAAPSPQVADPAGDWAVKSQDFTSARLSSALIAGKPHLRGELKLVEAPAAGVVTQYGFHFSVDCLSYVFAYTWPGNTAQARADLQRTSFCAPREATSTGPDATFPVTFAVKGTTLTWEMPYGAGISRGIRVRGFAATACPGFCGITYGTSWNEQKYVWTGDVAWNANTYVVGSDLPRR